jgi:hypothetical protein
VGGGTHQGGGRLAHEGAAIWRLFSDIVDVFILLEARTFRPTSTSCWIHLHLSEFFISVDATFRL